VHDQAIVERRPLQWLERKVRVENRTLRLFAQAA
jgi:hypothetical protein